MVPDAAAGLDHSVAERDEVWLGGVVLAGITANHCCANTARVSGKLLHRVLFALDASHTFDRPGPDGQIVSADELSRITATNLHGEFATTVSTRHLHGLQGEVVKECTHPFGPVLTERAQLLESRGLVPRGGRTERLVVIKAQAARVPATRTS